jgi:REP element-mobilizing transposase RayT
LKGISAKMIREEFKKELKEYYRNPVLRAVWYFICTVWEINDKIIKQYIEEQWKEDILEDGFDV